MPCWLKAKQFLLQVFFSWAIIRCCHVGISAQNSTYSTFDPEVIVRVVETSCFVAFSTKELNLSSVFEDIRTAFHRDEDVVIRLVDLHGDSLKRKWDKKIKILNPLKETKSGIIVFPRRKLDRSCLLTSGLNEPQAIGETYTGAFSTQSVLSFINQKCNTYRHRHGYLDTAGLHRAEILGSLFHVENASSISMKDLSFHCSKGTCQDFDLVHTHNSLYKQSKGNQIRSGTDMIHKCDKIDIPSKTEFFHEYLKLSKPVIIKNAMENWPAMNKWSNDYFRANHGGEQVHIKLTPQGVFEGVDSASEFENFETFKVPADVRKQLPFPDLVVVRPATQNMNFSKFIDLMESVSDGTLKGLSAYLEYSSLSDIVADLEFDVLVMPFIDRLLTLEHLNMWLSDGNTLGKLHFDPFDNFLCQISGKKEVLLFSPHDNTKLYEAHIPEAMLAYDNASHTFVKKKLMDSTSMVMSPIDLSNPNFQRFPKFADAHPMNCTIEEGEVLFMPAFWWHEVQSHPSPTEKRNLAVNFWYDPFFTKEFPCQECRLDVNPNYRHLL